MKTIKGLTRLQALREILAKPGADGESEQGFTLIELMVVLLIMAILLAIAIPTFLGVTSGAKTTAAQSNLTNALITAKTVYQKSGNYTFTTPAKFITAMNTEDPAIQFKATNVEPASGQSTISVLVGSTTAVVLTAQDANGGCWVIMDNEGTGTVDNAKGGQAYGWVKSTTAHHATTCQAVKAVAKMVVSPGNVGTSTYFDTTSPATSAGPLGWTVTSFAGLGKTLP